MMIDSEFARMAAKRIFEEQDGMRAVKVWSRYDRFHPEPLHFMKGMVVPKNVERKQVQFSDSMVFVRGGTFTMGSNDSEKSSPPHTVSVSDFYIARHQVTQGEYFYLMGGIHEQWLGERFPEQYVSWNEAVLFCNEASRTAGLTPCYTFIGGRCTCDWNANGYRLPTEAEWEYSARGGEKHSTYKYSGSDNIDSVAWYCKNSDDSTHEVMTKVPNALGIYDMGSNVHELCYDYYAPYPDTATIQNDPKGPKSGKTRVLRGGCYLCPEQSSLVYNRYYPIAPAEHEPWIGFRLARNAISKVPAP